MQNKKVRDIMLPLSDYAVVTREASLREALLALRAAQRQLPPGREGHRAVLVADGSGRIVGKVGQLDFLRALEPKYAVMARGGEELARAGLDEDFVNSIMDNYRLWQDDMQAICRRAQGVTAGQAMRPIEAGIEEDRSLTEAMHRMIVWQCLSLLVTAKGRATGILRLSDLFAEVSAQVATATEDCS